MIAFPDSNAETEYTDPNGSVWQFNGTGWVRQADCPDNGGGEGDANVQGGQVPAGYINLGTTAYESSLTVDRTSTPICFGKDIYRVFYQPAATGPDYFRYSQWEIDDVGDATKVGGLNMLAIPSNITSTDVMASGNAPPWDARLKNYLFRSTNQPYGDVYFKQNADKTLSLGRLQDIGMDSWFWNSETYTHGCFASSDGESLVFALTRGGSTNAGIARIGISDVSGDLELLDKSDGTQPFGLHIAITEAEYEGYDRPCIFYSTMTPSGETVTYNYWTLTPDLQAISSLSDPNIQPESGLTIGTDAFAARYRNNRGLAWITDLSRDFSSMAGPVVNADGQIDKSSVNRTINKEESGKRFNYIIGKGVVSSETNRTSVGCGAVGSTCRVYATDGETLSTGNHYFPYTPAYLTADSYYYRTQVTGSVTSYWRSQGWQLQSSATAYGFAPCQGMHIVSAGESDQFYVSNGSSSDANVYVWEDAEAFIEDGVTLKMVDKLQRVSEQAAEFAAMEINQGDDE